MMPRRPSGRQSEVIAVDDFHLTLRRLTVRDDDFVSEVLGSEQANREASCLDAKVHALVQIGALIALDAAPQSYSRCVDVAQHAGASAEEIVGVLVAAMPVAGGARVVSAAPKLGLALGYDLDAALEEELGLSG